jgi:hypothetical protein
MTIIKSGAFVGMAFAPHCTITLFTVHHAIKLSFETQIFTALYGFLRAIRPGRWHYSNVTPCGSRRARFGATLPHALAATLN